MSNFEIRTRHSESTLEYVYKLDNLFQDCTHVLGDELLGNNKETILSARKSTGSMRSGSVPKKSGRRWSQLISSHKQNALRGARRGRRRQRIGHSVASTTWRFGVGIRKLYLTSKLDIRMRQSDSTFEFVTWIREQVSLPL